MEWWEDEGLGLKKTDVEAMREAWRREKAAPEMLEFEEELVRRLREQMQLQEDTIMAMEGDGDGDDISTTSLQLQHMDLDRALFLLKSYLRLRLTKLQKHLFFYASLPHSSSPLSPQELLFCHRCLHATSRHLHHSLLSLLPSHYQSLSRQSTSSDHDDMLHSHSAHLDTFVFCKPTTDVGAFQLDDTGDDIVDLVVDDLYVLRYNSIRALVQSRRIHLI
ncbi:DNA replication complex GINS protein SLD5 [Rhynchospora pubera]|uniref:DNA replication complex GINS protein SLD5 n=1 Tax=Rhynchospora pubera TaxID=906938 RepID=A0AAV8C1N9_9POAL|nr:DNA replication complex GINS protein SLD5 [Rhynchospora pubera]KAJ4749190.1 DNA replication complex GINS protein SLD5 [Rhynchospora pubera]